MGDFERVYAVHLKNLRGILFDFRNYSFRDLENFVSGFQGKIFSDFKGFVKDKLVLHFLTLEMFVCVY